MTATPARSGRMAQRGGWATGDRRRRQRGQIIIMFTLSLALFLFTLFVAVVDLEYLFTESARAQGAAEVAAESGANSVNPNFLYTGSGPIINEDSSSIGYYETACIHAGNVSAGISPATLDSRFGGVGTHCKSSGGCQVGATVTKHVNFPITILGLGADVRGSFVAAPVIGANGPTANQATCPYVPPPGP